MITDTTTPVVNNNDAQWVCESLKNQTSYSLDLSRGIHCVILVDKENEGVSLHAYETKNGEYFMYNASWTGRFGTMVVVGNVRQMSSGKVSESVYNVFFVHFIDHVEKLPQDVQRLFDGKFGLGETHHAEYLENTFLHKQYQ